MRRIGILTLLVAITAGIVLAQTPGESNFQLVRQIGQPPPRGMIYDTNHDRFAWVDVRGSLNLVDASTLNVQHTLYERGSYSAYTFSNDGRWLAVAIDTRVELWNTATGEKVAEFNPDGALQTQGPLIFTEDDRLLQFNTLVRAPRAIRQSENDTVNLPWIWDLPNARGEQNSTLPNRVEAFRFFDYRFSLVLGAGEQIIAGLPERMQILEFGDDGLEVTAEITDANRFERDPIDLWVSADGAVSYTRRVDSTNLLQLNPQTDTITEIPLEQTLNFRTLDNIDTLRFGNVSRIIGESNSLTDYTLLRLLLGNNYQSLYSYHPLTVTLIDILQPRIVTGETRPSVLLHIFDEETQTGVIRRIVPLDVLNMVLHPEGDQLLVRRESGNQEIELYDLTTGAMIRSLQPALPSSQTFPMLAYNRDGSEIITDFQRFEAQTGAVMLEDLRYNNGFVSYFFGDDSRTIRTLDANNQLWTWDLTTGEIIDRETLDLRGDVWRTWDDGTRYLTQFTQDPDEDGVLTITGVEVYNTGTDERRTLFFDNPNQIEQVIPSPDWEHFLVVYSSDPLTPHHPNNAVAVYELNAGLRWQIVGEDLPPLGARQYGWINHETIYVSNAEGGAQSQPRIYGIDYAPSGLPTCLVDAFPEEHPRWIPLWERLVANLRFEALADFTIRICDFLPAETEAVDQFFTPTPIPTEISVTRQPIIIADVPVCLTQRFSQEALDYAEAWREIAGELDEEQRAELETLLCEGLAQGGDIDSRSVTGANQPNLDVLTMNIETGIRSVGGYIPFEQQEIRGTEPLVDALQDQRNVFPNSVRLSPDETLLAAEINSGYIQVYRIPGDYDSFIATVTATHAALEALQDDEIRIGLRATPTPAFDQIGEPRPTPTPTVTPTLPPLPEQRANLSERDQITEVCPANTPYTPANLPADYAPPGEVFALRLNSSDMWRLDLFSGELRRDETVPPCFSRLNCVYSPDEQWVYYSSPDRFVVSRTDGSASYVLFDAGETTALPPEFYWISPRILEYRYNGYLPDERNQQYLRQRFDVTTGEITPPEVVENNEIRINTFPAEIVTNPVLGSPYRIVRVIYDAGASGTGYRYYVYNQDTGDSDHFMTITDQTGNISGTVEWNPSGDVFYYQRQFDEPWYVYDVRSGERRELGSLPPGTWSPDGRYIARWRILSDDEITERLENDQLPLTLAIWNSETGSTRHYCIPGLTGQSFDSLLRWSPDERYLIFRTPFTAEFNNDIDGIARPHTVILDTETGAVVDLSLDVSDITAWINTWEE